MKKWAAAAIVLGQIVVRIGEPAPSLAAQSSGDLSAQEQRGKDIYFGTGSASASPIRATVGNPPAEAPPMLLACANCHGSDGRGKPEGGVVPSNITWDALTKPYGVTHPRGRTHPPYTDRLIVRAICMGIDSAGAPLHSAMPRFIMSRDDAAALTSYLKRLEGNSELGISETSVRVGTILPSTGPLGAAGNAVRAVLEAYFDSLNRQGGIYGRRIELHVAARGESAAEAGTNAEAFLRDIRPFAMVAGLIEGIETEVVAASERARVPFVGPLTIFPTSDPLIASHTFYLLSGVEQQARALLDYGRVLSSTATASLAIVYSERVVPQAIVGRLGEYATRTGWDRVRPINRDPGGDTSRDVVDALARDETTQVLLLASSGDVFAIAAEMAKRGWTPPLLVPGSLAENDLLNMAPAFVDRVLLALPSLPSDQTDAGATDYRALADAYGLPRGEQAAQLAALGSAKVLIEAMKLAGRTVNREKLVATLERLDGFNSGLMPTISFSRGRRLGAPGAYIVTVDPRAKRFKQITGWRAVE